MSKKNSSANLKNGFRESKDLSKVYQNFKSKLDKLNKKNYLVAVSGGPDSLALVALSKAYMFHKKSKFHFVLIDHKIRKNSALEAKKVKNLLKRKKINLKVLNNKKVIVKNIQAEARNSRYKILINYCNKNGIQTLLTAHNLEDQVETFLMRLSRGSGLKGLSAMKPSSNINTKVKLFRPLLDVKKSFLIKISKNIFGTYIKDPSNKDLKFLRTKVRNLKIPLEKSGIKYEQIFRSIQNLTFSRNTLENYLNTIFEKIIKKKNNEISINYKKYDELSDDIKFALINRSIKLLKKNYYDLRSKKVVNLIESLKKKDFKKSTLGGCFFFKKDKNLCLKIEKI